ncbi:hypothetical protein RN001_003646 [Aquatica leii]|uniref:SWIM-type domain-containing protein n=1 Tax=Aquatica leii TaxID=1421715 RepID=A0AAN7QBV5_9COLE|nr:hypothetical protein RN001_003646 [Aquatica leii]
MFKPCIEMVDIMELVGDFKRPYIEGSAILKAKHIVECGIIKNSESEQQIAALCLQTSNLNGIPHEVRINITKNIDDKVITVSCTCKAGTGKCKHVVAVCMYLNRIPLQNLEDLSCTDMMQQWGKMKNDVKVTYEPQPITNFCHVDKKIKVDVIEVAEDLRKQVLNLLLKGAPESNLAVHRQCRKESVVIEQTATHTICENLRPQITELLLAENVFLLGSKALDAELLSSFGSVNVLF